MKKKILLISPSELCVGGVSKVLMTLVEELHEEYTFDVVTLRDRPGYYDDAFSSYGGKIYKIPSIQYVDHKILYPLSFFQIRKAVAKILKENQYDVIHCHSGWQDAPCHLAAMKAGVPVRISHGHGTYNWTGRNLVMRAYFTKRIIRKYAQTRLACASVAGDTLFSGAPYENILNPVDVSLYADIDKNPHDGIHLLQIGYFCKNKNQIFSIRLLNHLVNLGVNAQLSFVGYPHPAEQGYHEQMLSLIAQHHMEEHISFLPHDFDKRVAFAQADYCLLPSESEGLPLVALESQAAGVACLMSDNISRDSDVGAGFFIPHDDLEKWADTIISGVKVNKEQLTRNLQTISTRAYADKIRNIYEQKY